MENSVENWWKEYFKEMGIQVASGGSAGFVEVSCMHPLDLVKTRLQVQANVPKGSKDPKLYTGVFDCMSKMYVNEGFLAFYKGIVPPIIAETPKRAIKFMTFEQYKKLFMFGHDSPHKLTWPLAGFAAGVTEAIFVNPFEVVKVTLQSNKEYAKKAPSTWEVTRHIIETEGLGFKGLNKGLSATMGRNAVFNAIYFGLYFNAKNLLPAAEDELHELFRKISLGFLAGTLGSLANLPFDVAKSRIQGPQPIPGQRKYKATLPTIATIYKEEGFKALYKGLTPKVMRLGPGGAIMMVVYEYVHGYLKKVLG